MSRRPVRRLCLLLGDQLDRESPLFTDFDREQDYFWMAEVAEEADHIPVHKQRIALFMAAMRHFAAELTVKQYPLHFLKLESHDYPSLASALHSTLLELQPEEVHVVRPGEYRVLAEIATTCRRHKIPLKQHHDTHFLSTPADFQQWADGRKSLRMEFWYRELRKRYEVLLEDGSQPIGGKWNYDHDNRESFKRAGPQGVPQRPRFKPDNITLEVIRLVNQRYADHSGELSEQFNWAVTPAQAEQALDDFMTHVLPDFGRHQDAMWTQQPFLFHSLLSSALNLKLLHPLTVIRRAEQAYWQQGAPLAAVEGFIRQILGWREFVRGLYWLHMPDWYTWNHLEAQQDLPAFYWTGDTDMVCLREAIGQTLQHGYAHHIQRLMVTGLFAQLYGVQPMQVHEWYLSVYVDAVEWVELPNTLGMSQYADGGIMASKPYIASGNYVKKMSNYCSTCAYRPEKAVGNDACPFTTLFWAFLDEHEAQFTNHPRMAFMLKNLQRKSDEDRQAIREQAVSFRTSLSQPASPAPESARSSA